MCQKSYLPTTRQRYQDIAEARLIQETDGWWHYTILVRGLHDTLIRSDYDYSDDLRALGALQRRYGSIRVVKVVAQSGPVPIPTADLESLPAPVLTRPRPSPVYYALMLSSVVGAIVSAMTLLMWASRVKIG